MVNAFKNNKNGKSEECMNNQDDVNMHSIILYGRGGGVDRKWNSEVDEVKDRGLKDEEEYGVLRKY